MRILFMGSAAFAVPTLSAIVRSRHDVIEVVAQPDKPAGRGMKITACPVAAYAAEHGIALYQPKGVRKPDVIDHFRKLSPDLIVIIAYGRILPKELLDIPPLGCVNVHSSLLPKYRGAAPINWAIANGETETGVTTMRVDEEMDAGDILMSANVKIGYDEDAVELHDRLAPLGAELLMKTIDAIERGTIRGIPQDHSEATFAPIIKKEDGRIDWTMGAREILNRVRGFKPWPGASTSIGGKMLRIHGAKVGSIAAAGKPGEVIEAGKDLVVACGSGALELTQVQIEGKKKMSAADFLRGNKIEVGAVLGKY